MLLKVFVDKTFPVPVKPGMVMWVALDDLPLGHPQNVQSLLKALKVAASTKLPLDQLYITCGANVIDIGKTPVELGLVPNAQLTVNSQPPASPRRRTMSQSGGQTPRADGTPRITSPRGDQDAAGGDEDTSMSPRGQSMIAADSAEDEEYYEAAECGWFPFVLHRGRKGTAALVIDPSTEPTVDDEVPTTIALCDACTAVVEAAESLAAPVDRHYKPMLLETTVAEGWVEKLGGTRIQRWQKRYLCVSEQSVDWYEEKPSPGAKPKIRGTRAVQQNDEFCIVQILETFDPKQYPKTTDSGWYYFGVLWRSPDQTTLYRVRLPEERTHFVGFFKRMVKRWEQHGGASRDPVHWKQWADRLLVTMHDSADECRVREDAFDAEERESGALREAIRKTREARPALQAANAERLARVEDLKAQLRALDEVRLRHRKAAEAAEAKVAEEEAKLHDLVEECSEEARHHKFLEQRAEEQRREATTDIATLEDEIDVAAAAKRRAFAQWRRLEEHHTDRSGPQRALRGFSFSVDLL